MNASSSSTYRIVIPARYASERLPGKVLLEIDGLPLLQHVWQRAKKSNAESIVIATDDVQIVKAATAFGAEVVLTSREHNSGSDRITQCATQLQWPDEQLIVNLQGDEPLMPPACLDQVAELMIQNPQCEIASLYWPISDGEEVQNPNVVKVVVDANDRAMYFSRSPIPYARGFDDIDAAMRSGTTWKRHLGLYAYRLSSLRKFTAAEPSPLEQTERLEQLRMMEQGGHIVMARASEFIPAGVDTQADLDRIRKQFESN